MIDMAEQFPIGTVPHARRKGAMKKNRKDIHIWAAAIIFTLPLLCLSSCEKVEEVRFEAEKEKVKSVGGKLKKILIVHSYQKGLGWNNDTETGVIDGLKKKGYVLGKNYELKKFYMDTKVTYVTPEQIKQRGDHAIKLTEEFDPDLVVVNDDNALKHVAVPYTMNHPKKKLPFVFVGINADPTIYEPIESLERPGHSITGALERFPFYQGFSLARQILPHKKRVVLMADSSPSSNFIVNAFKKRYLEKVKDSKVNVEAVIQVKTFQEWKDRILEYQDKADLVGIVTYYQLLGENGAYVPPREVVMWTINHSRLPEIGFLLFHSEEGYWMSVGVSPYKTGIYVGELAGKILDGHDPRGIPIVDPKSIDIAFNLERSKMLGIDLPIDILDMATVTYKKIREPRWRRD